MSVIERKLGFGHKGNGLVVWDSLHTECGDYQSVAHIRSDRSVKYFIEDLDQKYIDQIEQVARENDSNVSMTQEQKIFKTRPVSA